MAVISSGSWASPDATRPARRLSLGSFEPSMPSHSNRLFARGFFSTSGRDATPIWPLTARPCEPRAATISRQSTSWRRTPASCELRVAVAQLRVDSKTNEHKAALELLGVLPLEDKIVTADAMFTHRDFCTEVRRRQGHYVLPSKENQPNLVRDVRAAFDDPPAGLSPPADAVARREF